MLPIPMGIFYPTFLFCNSSSLTNTRHQYHFVILILTIHSYLLIPDTQTFSACWPGSMMRGGSTLWLNSQRVGSCTNISLTHPKVDSRRLKPPNIFIRSEARTLIDYILVKKSLASSSCPCSTLCAISTCFYLVLSPVICLYPHSLLSCSCYSLYNPLLLHTSTLINITVMFLSHE